jgi:hypothetical protein
MWSTRETEVVQHNQTAEATRSEAIGLRNSAPPLRTRMQVKPGDPNYDKHVLAHIKAKLIVDPVNGCWLWQGYVRPDATTSGGIFVRGGYGQIGYRGRSMPVHRAMWTILHGAPSSNVFVCHTCDVRHCCNPDHLWLGSNADNIRDMVAKKRGPKAGATHCIRGHEFTPENTLIHSGKWRACKACQRIHQRKPERVALASANQKRRRAEKRAARLTAGSVA